MRWFTIVRHVDIQTGELLRPEQLKSYTKIKRKEYVTRNSTPDGEYATRTIIYECEPSKQGTLF